ncbi:MAG: lipid IV(A) 3-deoxy-D-manno-octulosonic acid transferase [Pseudomonadota bacterium]
MRTAYAILTYLMLPLYALYWVLRGLGNRTYWDRLGQRYGFGFPQLREGAVWVHAVSVGEVQAAAPLVRALQQRFPERDVLVTTMTPTGAERVRILFGDSVYHCYLPFETTYAVQNFFDAVKPALALVMETEIWPNLYHACGKRGIPLVLVSARISPKSVKRYRRLLPMFREALSHGILIAAQGETDAKRFLSLGAVPERTWIMGNIKFDFELPKELPANGAAFRDEVLGRPRPVWIAASTHDKEEELVLDAHREVLAEIPDALLVLVPRHPERFGTVAQLLKKRKFSFVSRTGGAGCNPETEVYLGDTMGELPVFYAASDVAFVGGTLVPIGGHNLLEPGALGLPVITGPHLFNTQDIADLFTDSGASIIVKDSSALATGVIDLLRDSAARESIGRKGRQIVDANRGALKRLLVLLSPQLERVGER